MKLRVGIPGREYDILIENGSLDRAGGLIGEVSRGKKLAVVTDSNVAPLYAGRLEASLAKAGFEMSVTVVPAGEASKSVSMLSFVYDGLMSFGLTRSDAVVALGGGVVGDLAGFAAATILRGVDFIQIPTTLLAQVDSSVGGKVAVNLPAGKNLAGAFHQPRLVITDPELLSTLPGRVFSDGISEVIKYGAIRDRRLFERVLVSGGRASLSADIGELVFRCCDIKRELVERDERDLGERMLLNFGHTLGHAYERAYRYEKYTHGEAVAAGMCAIARLGERMGLTEAGSSERIGQAVLRFGLPDRMGVSPQDLSAALGLDKKGDGGSVSLILLKRVGSAFIRRIPKDELLNLLTNGGGA